MKYKIYNQDVIEWANTYQKAKFHALISDTPYHLQSIVKRFGKKGSAPAKHGTDGVFSRSSKGFMGQTWDGGDIAFRPETWEALGEHLYPGAFGMCFSASRNWHRLAVAIEDAGMIIHPTIFGWLNGQGFPKATNISKQLHKQGNDDGMWEGHRYGLQALKPAVEPIIVFQKPYEGKPLQNIVETGAGAINIDGGRIPLNGDSYVINTFDDGAKPWGDAKGEKFTSRKVKDDPRLGGKGSWKTDKAAKNVYEGGYAGVDVASSEGGRWPANFILDESVAGRLDEQSGKKAGHIGANGYWEMSTAKGWNENSIPYKSEGYEQKNDFGGASRFFYNVQEQIDEADPIYYCGKVSPKERNAGLDEYEEVERRTMGTGMVGVSGDRISGTGTPIEMGVTKTRNPHPTLKPIALAKYLATLLLPPIEYAPRRILVPFSGVCSEMIGAMQAGWEHIVGIEFDTENGYVDLGHKRMEYWSSK
jgi:hypothetical protein